MEKENKIDNKGAKPVADVKKKVNVELEVDTSVKAVSYTHLTLPTKA